MIDSLAPGRYECDYKNVIFNLVLLIGNLRSSHDTALWCMPLDLTDDKSTLVQVMAWCRQATSHYLSQCWLSSLLVMASLGPNELRLILQGLYRGHNACGLLLFGCVVCTCPDVLWQLNLTEKKKKKKKKLNLTDWPCTWLLHVIINFINLGPWSLIFTS